MNNFASSFTYEFGTIFSRSRSDKVPLGIRVYEILERLSEVKVFFSVSEAQDAYSLLNISKMVSSTHQNFVCQC